MWVKNRRGPFKREWQREWSLGVLCITNRDLRCVHREWRGERREQDEWTRVASERREQHEGGLRVMSERENELGLAKVKEINVREILGESGEMWKKCGKCENKSEK
jgi:hypothetical protein